LSREQNGIYFFASKEVEKIVFFSLIPKRFSPQDSEVVEIKKFEEMSRVYRFMWLVDIGWRIAAVSFTHILFARPRW